eukprot:m.18653 g.18653  ORF g.18653 m.18653 type:complete len:214 (+) comp6375_c0_seq1:181-822(+)
MADEDNIDELCDVMQANVLTTLKLLVIGDSGVGKSSLLVRFIEDTFDEDHGPTIGVDFKSKVVDVHGNKVKLTIWDTAGQERFRTLTASYYRGAHGVIFVYDVCDKDTFDHISMWLNELEVYATNQNIVKMLVGNKIDQPNRAVTTQTGMSYARDNEMLFIEASAKDERGVKQAFDEVTQKVLDTPTLWGEETKGSGIRLDKGGTNESCACVI